MAAAPSAPLPSTPGPESDALALAGRWLSAYEALTARAAHEINNALNGVAMNLEVVRLRARPGADAERVAPFAEAASGEQDQVAALAGALVALGRTPRAGATDVRSVVRHACTLVGAAARHDGVTVELVDDDGPAITAAPARAVRLAVVALLLAGMNKASVTEAATQPSRPIRCILRAGAEAAVSLDPGAVGLEPELVDLLTRSGVGWHPIAARLTFPPA